MSKHIYLTPEQKKILHAAFRRGKVTCNQYNWWVLTDMVSKGVLDKVIPRNSNSHGWPYFKLSPRGLKIAKRTYKAASKDSNARRKQSSNSRRSRKQRK